MQIWSEHTQNPPAAWWWIGILGTILMHQSSARRQMTVNCFSDKSVVWDSTDWGWIEALPRWSWRGGSRKPCQGNQMMTPPYSAGICRLPLGCISHFQLVWQTQRWNRTKCCLTKGESVGFKWFIVEIWWKFLQQHLNTWSNSGANINFCQELQLILLYIYLKYHCQVQRSSDRVSWWIPGQLISSVHKAPIWISRRGAPAFLGRVQVQNENQ